MTVLNDLMDIIDELETKDNYAYEFVTSIQIQKEEYPQRKVTGKQFSVLVKLHNKYCKSNQFF